MESVKTFDAFLSYHWRDRAQVEALARQLHTHDLRVFLDRWYLQPGHPWPQELQRVLAACRAVVVCIGRGDMGPWQQREVNLALERQSRETSFAVIPVLLPGAEPVLGFLGQNTWIDLRGQPDDTELLAALVDAIRGEPPSIAARERISNVLDGVCPYRGLLSFREEDAPFFFGRDAAIAQLCNALTHRSFVALLGASGSGKSSVVRAGLVPALRRRSDLQWEFATLVPGDRPWHALAAALLPLLEPVGTETDRLIETSKLAHACETGDLELRDLVERLLAKQIGTDRLLIVVDQAEELYTLTDDASVRRRVVDSLLDASARAPLTVVFTLRGDFVGHALSDRRLSDRLQGAQVNLGPMTRAELELAITRPAEKVGLAFEPGLVERVLDDAGDEPGHLPLLEFVLKQLWSLRHRGHLLHAVYDDIGRLQGAVAQKADMIVEQLSPLEQQVVQRIFLQLATPAEGGDYVRRRASFGEMSASSMPVLRRLTDERLLVTAPGGSIGEETIEVCHEALIHHWHKLRAWLDEDREFLLWRRRFREFSAPWRRDRTREGTLLGGAFLVEAEKWLSERHDRLPSDERDYIEASVARRNREQRTTRRRTRVFVSVVTVLAGVAVLFAFNSQIQKRRAEAEAIRSLALQLAAQSGQRMNSSLAEALLLAVAAADLLATDEVKDNLFRLTRTIPDGLRGFLWGHSNWVHSIAFAPDGKSLATGSADNTVILWDTASRSPLGQPLRGHKSGVMALGFGPDGKTLTTVSGDHTAVLWDVGSRKPLGESQNIRGHTAGTYITAAFHPDGKTLITGSFGILVLWDMAGRAPLGQPLKAHSGTVMLAISRDGRRLATASASRGSELILWDLERRVPIAESPSDHEEGVFSIAFSPDGALVATGSRSPSVILRNAVDRQRVGALDGHRDRVVDMAFSPDGKTLVTAGGTDRNVIVWDIATREPRGQPLRGHADTVTSVAVSHDGTTLATGSFDRTVMLWDLHRLTMPWMVHENLDASKRRACEIVNRNFTLTEWRRFAGQTPYRRVCPDAPGPGDPGWPFVD